MIPSPSALTGQNNLGNDAAWLLAFYREKDGKPEPKPAIELGRDQYYAEIYASLPGGLEGGVYTIRIEGITDQHYAEIAQKDSSAVKFAKLYLYWRDTNMGAKALLANLAGLTDTLGGMKSSDLPESTLVAVLRILSVTRALGSRMYEVVIEAQESVYYQLANRRLAGALSRAKPVDAAKQLGGEAKIQVEVHQPEGGGKQQAQTGDAPGEEEQPFASGRTCLETMKDIGQTLEDSLNQHGRGMFLIRNGTLHVGPRPIPIEGPAAKPMELTLAGGLIEVQRLAAIDTNPTFDWASGGPEPKKRAQYRLLLKGRPDLKPGSVVATEPPPEELEKPPAGLGAVSMAVDLAKSLLPSRGEMPLESPAYIYVTSALHQFGRTTGFSTTLMGVHLKDLKDPWDHHTRASTEAPGSIDPASPNAAARSINKRIASELYRLRLTDVGEVREMASKGNSEPLPGQTLRVWRGLEPADGRAGQARRLAIRKPTPAPLSGVPYLTPFAWGKCGLVLPRYPGTRVLLTHRNGREDPIDAGALWKSGRGPESEPGDWWLSLPVGVAQNDRAKVDDAKDPAEHTGKVTQDLIDGDGRRVIEVGEFTIRVGKKSLQDAGKRPAVTDDESLTIEHSSGSKIVMKNDGSVLIEAKKNLDLKSTDGDINMTAKNVMVKVDTQMDVS